MRRYRLFSIRGGENLWIAMKRFGERRGRREVGEEEKRYVVYRLIYVRNVSVNPPLTIRKLIVAARRCASGKLINRLSRSLQTHYLYGSAISTSISPPLLKGYAERSRARAANKRFFFLFFYSRHDRLRYVCIPMGTRKGFYLITRGIIHYYERWNVTRRIKRNSINFRTRPFVNGKLRLIER